MDTVVVYFGLVLARAGTGVAVLPLFGGATPRKVKAGLALALAIFWFCALSIPPEMPAVAASWPLLLLAVGREALLGALLGLAFGLFMVPPRVAGELLAQQFGLSLGNVVGPAGTSPAGALTLILETLSGLLFLSLDLHHVFLAALHATFLRHPVGTAFGAGNAAQLVNGVAAANEMGVMLAAPLAVTMFLLTICLAFLSRAAPQLSIYSVGLPVQVLVGLTGMLVFLPEMMGGMARVASCLSEYLTRVL